MKKNYFFALLIILSLQGFSQNIGIKPNAKTAMNSKDSKSKLSVGLSPSTAILLSKLTNQKSTARDSILQTYSIVEKNTTTFLKAFLISSSNTDLSNFGFIENSNMGGILTGLIDVDKIEILAKHSDVRYIEIASKVKPLLNNAMLSTRVDRVHQGVNLSQSYFGDGVVVGIIDVGFDYTHPTFYDSTYTTYRVKKVWEQSATVGSPPSGYSYGRELVGQNTIVNAQTDNNSESHGSHVAGTAAGSGAGTSDIYRGVAFKSDLILVSTDFTDVGIAEGIEYIIDYANSVNKPCVINMSLGKHFGPHDGTSIFDQACDFLSGNGKLIVGAAGNEGLDSIYLGKTFSGNDTVIYSFVNFPNSTLSTNGSGVIDIWGVPNQNFSISVNIYNTNTDSFEDWTPYISSSSNTTYNYTLNDNDPFFTDDCIVDISTEISPLNNKPHIVVEIDHTDQDDNYRWALIEIIGHNTSTKMWASSSYFTSNNYNFPILGGSTNFTVGEIGGTGNSVISVGAYTSKNSYTNFSNVQQTIPQFAPVGEIAPFSSKGPTADNRTKPDITAPGNVIVAPVNSFDPNYTSSTATTAYAVTNGSKNWYYAALEGTSMATPMVTGILALWLEANPNLSPSQALSILKNNAITDSFTGTISASGDNTWGWGKIDAYDGLVNIVGIGENSLNRSILSVYPNPSSGNVFINSSDNEQINLRVTDMVGRLVINSKTIKQGINQIDVRTLKNGLYLLNFEKNGINYSHKLMINK